MAGAQNKRNSPGLSGAVLFLIRSRSSHGGSTNAKVPGKYKHCWQNSTALKFTGQPSPALSKSAPGNPIPMKDHHT